jgi:hypothetical protein
MNKNKWSRTAAIISFRFILLALLSVGVQARDPGKTGATYNADGKSILPEQQSEPFPTPPTPECENSWSLVSSLNWSGVADWDFHLQTPTAHIYYGNRSADGFTLDRDAYPACASGPAAPEQITGMGQCGTYTLYSNLFSMCGGSPSITFSATVTALKQITINGVAYDPGQVFHPQNNVAFAIDATSGCDVGPLTPLTDPAAVSFEAGNTIDTNHLNSNMQAALSAFRAGVTGSGGNFVLNSAYRPPQYQAHLREVWLKWNQLRNNTNSSCQTLRSQVQAEITRHGLQNLRTRPASPTGMHTMGAAIDVSVDPAITGLPLNTLLLKACASGLYRRLPTTDKVHFEIGACSSPPRDAPDQRGGSADWLSGNIARTPSTAPAADPQIWVEVSVENLADGTARYRYSLSNESGQDVEGLFIGYYDNDSELLSAPLGWDVDSGLPSTSVENPSGWQAEMVTTEEVPYLSLQWNANSAGFGLHSGSTTNSFATLLDGRHDEFGSKHWSVILADGQVVSGSLNSPPKFANISTRLGVGTGDNVLINGFIITGSEPKKVIVRAIGPSLSQVGVAGALTNPVLELHNSTGALIASNDNWQTTQIGGIINADQTSEIQNSGLAPTQPTESAIIVTLAPGGYTAIVRGENNSTGVGLVESYDLDTLVASKLANISTRGLVQGGDNVMIGGTIVIGSVATRIVVRAIGPSLPVSGKLADPTLDLYDGNGGLIASNDNWRSDQEAEIIATGLPPTNNSESAVVKALSPGGYTAIVRGKNGTTGVGLVEAYQLNN